MNGRLATPPRNPEEGWGLRLRRGLHPRRPFALRRPNRGRQTHAMHSPPPVTPGITRRRFALVLALLGVTPAIGCASGPKKGPRTPSTATGMLEAALADVDRRIKKHVKNRKRRTAALKVSAKAKDEIRQLNLVLSNWRDDMNRLPLERRRDLVKLRRIADEHNRRATEELETACRLAIELRAHITREEWPLVFPGPPAKGSQPC